MSIVSELQNALEIEEKRSVSDSFGGSPLKGKAPNYKFKEITQDLLQKSASSNEPIAISIQNLKRLIEDDNILLYIVTAAIRFSFLIELTNLKITSTKLKTRWQKGDIIKTKTGSFENYKGEFSPGKDERAATYTECVNVFISSLNLISGSKDHISILSSLSKNVNRCVPYEFVLTYKDYKSKSLHSLNNIRLVKTDDINWLIKARNIILPSINNKNRQKLKTKTYKTDRSQTGEVQTNRAKRWECLSDDFQHATIEECWSVEKKLLSDLVYFQGYPKSVLNELIKLDLIINQDNNTVCPITFDSFLFTDFESEAKHGESSFQVGHLTPLKANGRHTGKNISWISEDGNRIQGDLSIIEVRKLLTKIFNNMQKLKLLTK